MQATTHTTSSLALGLLPIAIAPNLLAVEYLHFYIGGLVIGSLFPDIDEPNSRIGRYVSKDFPALPRTINFIFGHRGITHRFIFALFFFLIFLFFKTDLENIHYGLFISGVAFSFGILFHQIGDMLSGSKYFKGGIRYYFFPFGLKDKYFTPFPKAIRCAVGDTKEKIYNILFVLIVVIELKQILSISIPF